jgi:hypothetical protein
MKLIVAIVVDVGKQVKDEGSAKVPNGRQDASVVEKLNRLTFGGRP